MKLVRRITKYIQNPDLLLVCRQTTKLADSRYTDRIALGMMSLQLEPKLTMPNDELLLW